MPITLPDLKNTHCVSFTACGEIKTTDKALIKWLKKDKKAVADLKTTGAKTYVRVSLGDYSGKHFHVDVTRQSSFPKNAIPVARLTVDQIQEKFENLLGKEVEVDLRGMFEIEIGELPESGLIKSLFFETRLGDVAIKMRGSKLSIKGAPVNEITWQILTEGKTIGVIIESENLKTTVTENYLTSTFETLQKALKVFVLGTLPNEPR